MASSKKSWAQKMDAKPRHQVLLDKAFAGVPAGSKLLISSPKEIAEHLNKTPQGTTVSVQQFRKTLAKAHQCDAACPVSTSIFLKIVAEHNYELSQQDPAAKLVPFWRVVTPSSTLAKKLSFDSMWLAMRLELEQ
jgi:hypothetical protein